VGCKESAPRADDTKTEAQPSAAVGPERRDDDALAERYTVLRAGFDADPEHFGGAKGSPELTATTAELRAITNEARDVHLRANAALLLGAVHQERGQWTEAAAAYRRAAELVPDDAGPWMALARAEAKAPDRTEPAIEAQRRALELDPDNLENYLALGELLLRKGDKENAATTYAAYEVRRKGLIDGLTLTKDGVYHVSIDERIACAEALAAATDIGTAVALAYALDKDPEPRVRAAVVRTMGIQRLVGYKEWLGKALAKEKDAEVRAAIADALAEIQRDPVELPKGPAPTGDGATPAAIDPQSGAKVPEAPTPGASPPPPAPTPAAGETGTDAKSGGTDPPG